MSNLEPIEDQDLDLKNKFTGGLGETEKKSGAKNYSEAAKEIKNLEFSEKRTEKAEERSIEKEKTYSKILSKLKSTKNPVVSSEEIVKGDTDEIAKLDTAEAKIDKLVKIAMVKGVVYAVKVARHMEDNYTLDEFHDKLMTEEFHKALVEKGMIKEI